MSRTESEFTLSHFLRRSGDVLKAAARRDVVLKRRDGDDLHLSTEQRSGIVRDGLLVLAETVLEAADRPEAREHLARALGSAVPWTSGLTVSQRGRLLADVARGAVNAAALGTTRGLGESLDRWRRTARLRSDRAPEPAHRTRRVAIPDDVDDPGIEKASGKVELPLRVRWSGPRRAYDLSDPRQLRRVYEQVLREGSADDVRRFIDVDTLVANWDELVLPPRVRRAWAKWLAARGVDVAC